MQTDRRPQAKARSKEIERIRGLQEELCGVIGSTADMVERGGHRPAVVHVGSHVYSLLGYPETLAIGHHLLRVVPRAEFGVGTVLVSAEGQEPKPDQGRN